MRFPFWLVTPVTDDPLSRGECGAEFVPTAFSDAERMAEYLQTKPAGQWEVRLVNRYSATEIFAELRARGCHGICYATGATAAEHQKLSLEDAIAQLEKSN